MIQLDDLTISKKLLILVIVGILAIIVVGCIGIFSTQQINGQLGELYQNKYAHSVLALEAYSDMMKLAVGGYMLTLEPDPVKKSPFRMRINCHMSLLSKKNWQSMNLFQ